MSALQRASHAAHLILATEKKISKIFTCQEKFAFLDMIATIINSSKNTN